MARLERIVAEVRRSVRWLAEHLAEFGADPNRLYVAGQFDASLRLGLLAAERPIDVDDEQRRALAKLSEDRKHRWRLGNRPVHRDKGAMLMNERIWDNSSPSATRPYLRRVGSVPERLARGKRSAVPKR
jgi:hypothetical protein